MGNVYGIPGGSVSEPGAVTWAANSAVAQIGGAAERRTGELLNRLAESSEWDVFHDLRVPGSRANIDHVLVGARSVVVIDTKIWKPGFYWTLGGATRRGWERVQHLDKQSIPMTMDRLAARLEPTGVRLARPVLLVWPSSARAPMRLGWYRPAGDPRVVCPKSDAQAARLLRRLAPTGRANPDAVTNLWGLLR